MGDINGGHYFLAGGGEMGELTLAKDWGKTQLGSPDAWPQSLRTTLGILLNSKFPMFLWWGTELTCFYNDAYRPSLGRDGKHPSILGMPAMEAWTEIWETIKPLIDKVMHGNESIWFEDMLIPIYRNGKIEDVYWTFSYSPVHNESGIIAGVLVTCTETTEKVYAIRKIEESNARFINNIMQAPVAMCIFRGKDHVVEIANARMLELWGKQAEDIINKPIFEGLPEAKDQGLETLVDTVYTTGEKFVANERPVMLPRNGSTVTTYVNFVYEALRETDGTISGIVATAIEVTEQVMSRSKVEESGHKVRALVENAPFPIAVYVGKEMIVELANESIINIWGKGNDVIGKSFKEVLPELDNQLVFEQINTVLETGQSFHTKNTPLDLIIDGKPYTYYFNYSLTPLYDINGKIYGVMNTGVDLTDLNIAKKKIEQSEQNLRSMVLQSPIGICVLDAATLVSEIVNESFIEVAGKPYEAIAGKNYWEPFAEAKPYYEAALKNVVDEGVPFYANEVEMMLIRHGKKETIYVTFVYAPLKNMEGEVKKVVVWVLDNTQQVMARQKIEEADKRFRTTVKQAPVGITILRGPQYVVEMANESYLELVGKDEDSFVGRPLFSSLPEVEEVVDPLLKGVFSTGAPYRGNEVPIPINRYGKEEVCFFDFLYAPLKEEDGSISGVIVTVTEVSEKVEARKKIEQNEERLSIVVEASELGTWELNLKTRQSLYSKRYLEIIGGYSDYVELTHEELLSHVHPDDLPTRAKAIKDAIASGHLHYEGRLVWKDGSVHWMESKGKVFYDAEGKPEKLIGTLRDTTEEKTHQQELEESEQKFRLLASSMPQHVWTSDTQGNLNYFNQSVYDYSGLTPAEMETGGWLQIVHPDDREENVKAWVDSIATGKDFLFEHRFRRHDGEYRWQLSRAIPQVDESGKIQMWVGTSTDIQEQKTFTNELEKQVAERTKELEQNNIDLEKMNRELQSFAYISSHDLQEPLRKIQTFATQIMEKEYQHLSDNGKDRFLRMHNAAQRMQTLINDLLTYSRTNVQERKFERTNLATIVQAVKEDLKEELEQKQAYIESSDMCEVEIIPFQFRQLMYNLISNALKFSIPGTVPHIRIESRIADGGTFQDKRLTEGTDYCHISISDNGIGFDQQYSERIFEVFQRLHGRNEFTGTGIGLAIVKKIVENHHGIITAKGELNKGATFDIYIPVT